MKRSLLKLSLVAAACMVTGAVMAQLAPDQNPNFAVSRDKYMKIADSVNEWHSTTIQDQHKAIDWLADRQQARTDRRDFRRQLRLERERWSGSYYSRPYYPRTSYHYYNNHYRGRRGYNSWGGFNFWWP